MSFDKETAKFALEVREAECPACGSKSFAYRKKTDDYRCRRCGEIVIPML